jgi:hypothetical protein
MRSLTKLLLTLGLATTIGACVVETHPHHYYPYNARCAYGWYWDGYFCRHY